MPTITLSATPKGNGYQAKVTFPDDGVSISSAETYPTIAEALTAAVFDMPERLEAMDRPDPVTPRLGKAFPLVGAVSPTHPLQDCSAKVALSLLYLGRASPGRGL